MSHKKIKSFEDACKATKNNPKKLPVVTGLPKEHQKAIIAHYKLRIIAEALNMLENGKRWIPDFLNYDQWKYTPYFTKNKSGVGFSFSIFDTWCTDACVGSRLCYRSSEIAEYAGKKFKSLYNDIIKY